MISSNTYRFKIQDINIIVSLDGSFCRYPTDEKTSSDKNIQKDIHYHPQNELFFINDYPLTVLGESSSVEFANCIACIPAFFLHNSIRCNDYRILFSYVAPNERKNEIYDFFEKVFSTNEPFTLKSNEMQYLYLKEITKYIRDSSPISNEIVSSLLKLIFLDIYNCNAVTNKNSSDPRQNSYFITIDSIIQNYQNEINLKVVADALHLSIKQASRVIRKHYKTSLSSLINQKRLMAACTLLESSDMAISEIVEYVNFPSDSYFYAQFKKRFGCTPLKYRKKYQAKDN